jgi:uncharacterized protein (TIGR03643 family)
MKSILSKMQIEEIVDLAMQDSVPFQAISDQFGLTVDEIVALMRATLRPRSYLRWKERRSLAAFRKHSSTKPDVFRTITTAAGRAQNFGKMQKPKRAQKVPHD